MIAAVLIAIGVALIAYVFYQLSRNNAQYFEKRKLKYIGVGGTMRNLIKLAFRRIDTMELHQTVYNAFPKES